MITKYGDYGMGLRDENGRLSMSGDPGYFPTVRVKEEVGQEVSQVPGRTRTKAEKRRDCRKRQKATAAKEKVVADVKEEMKDWTSVPDSVASVPGGGDYRGGHLARKGEYKEEYYGDTCESKKVKMEVILKHEIPNIKKESYP